MNHYIGIDIGSTCAKTVVMDEKKQIIHRLLQPTGWSSVDTALAIRELAEKLDIPYICVETDYSQSDSGQLSTRIEAFMEML